MATSTVDGLSTRWTGSRERIEVEEEAFDSSSSIGDKRWHEYPVSARRPG